MNKLAIRLVLTMLAGLLPLLAHAAPAQLAWRTAKGDEWVRLDEQQVLAREPLPATLQAPLGSLWKLMVYAWLVDTQQPETPYTCLGQARDEVYCCAAGASIDRDQALVGSCGLYFEAPRLGIDAALWRNYWQARHAPGWLQDLDRLKPETRVPVAELLDVLALLPAQVQARQTLLDVVLGMSDTDAPGVLGGRLRVKTWSWLAEHDQDARQGGFAGWLLDGTPIWVGGAGTGKMMLRRYASVLSTLLPTPWPIDTKQCIEVTLFSRYPITTVLTADGQAAAAGALEGHYRVAFVNGNQLAIESRGDLFLEPGQAHPILKARLEREDYVARVLQREATTQSAEAAKALSVVIRTYLLQNAQRNSNCLSIEDSSHAQRVAPRPATPQARAIAATTADLILIGSPVTYHSDLEGPNRLSWQDAVNQAALGLRYDAILARAFPAASLTRWEKPINTCRPLPDAEHWLRKQRRQWRTVLDAEPGYLEPNTFGVCRIGSGKPYIDRAKQRIYVRDMVSLQDRLDLTHEYLHLSFEAHPNGQDETYIEALARRLLLE